MGHWLYHFWLEEDGQDLVEYTLLIAFLAVACAALIGSSRPGINSIWTQANNELRSANR